MDIEICRAYIVVEGGRNCPLTKAIAKQFPIRSFGTRAGLKAGEAREPLAKVRGEMLGSSASWLYLVKDDEAGYAWEPAVEYGDYYDQTLRERGFHVDEPSEVIL